MCFEVEKYIYSEQDCIVMRSAYIYIDEKANFSRQEEYNKKVQKTLFSVVLHTLLISI